MVPPWKSKHYGSDRDLVAWDDPSTYIQELAFWDMLHAACLVYDWR